ncbi:MAG: DNA polymerase I, partial [Candidatus Heimdallarchaeota archaeon]|nr:DNA polymerase I [Candidatus Heimdallarchaeota archaeon]
MQRKTLYIVDGNAYCYRSYYAIGDLRSSAGQPTGAVFGFANMLNKLRTEVNPDYISVCFDLKGPTFRHEMFADYKANRKPMPDDLRPQIDMIKKVIRAYGIPVFEMKGYEADDIIASLAVQFKKDVDVFIVSPDKDMLQLVDNNVKIYIPHKDIAIIDETGVFERYAITPGQITDFLALVGDISDNIPGVPGIGPKAAVDLLSTFGSLENILDNIDDISQKKRRELLLEFSEQARLSKKLATVYTEVSIPQILDELEIQPQNTDLLSTLFRELELKNLLRSVLPKELASPDSGKFNIIDTKESLKQLKQQLISS